MPDDEAELIQRIKSGDEDALAAYVESKRGPLTAFVAKSTSDALRRKVEPDDIFQEVALSAVSAIDEIEIGDRDPFSWLCRLAERRIIDAHRRHFSQKRAADREVGLQAGGSAGDDGRGLIDILAASLTSPSRAFSRGQKAVALIAAMEQLAEDAREALRLRYLENLPSKEIAAQLGKTDGATRVLLTRSLQKLQKLLAGDELFLTLQPPSDG